MSTSQNVSMRGRKRKPVTHDDGSVFTLTPVKRERRVRSIETPKPPKDDSSLLNVVKSGKGFEHVVNKWIDEYDRIPDNGILQLQQLLIHSCGCRGLLTLQMLQRMTYSDIIRQITDDFDEDCAEYPIIRSGPQWRKFRQNFENFLKLLITKCRSGIIFDDRLMDGVIQMLTAMADSQVRAFRHTATFVAMKISTALVDLVVQLVELQQKMMRQIDTEKAKLKQKGTNEQLEVLLHNKAEVDEKISDIRDMTTFLFKSIFVHRYRDVVYDIRCICVSELGNWMKTHPSYFLDDSCLKYLGWLLFDKVPEVRVKCIQALLPLFEEMEYIGRLELFLTKFKDRLVSMVLDRDIDVAVKCCVLMTKVFQYFPDLLEPKDCVPIYEAVYHSNRLLAVAAGDFLNTKVFEGTQEIGDNRNKILISDLILFYVEGDIHHHAAYLVDALIDTSPMIKDWSTMVEMLQSDECDNYDTQLVEILAAAVRQASTGEPPFGRATAKRITKDVKMINDDRMRISEVLIPELPKLIKRHIDDQGKIVNLTSIAQHFVLDLYLTARKMKDLDELVSAFDRVVEQHSDEEIMQNIAAAFSYFKSNLAVQQHIEAGKNQLLDTLAIQLRTSLQQFQNEGQMDEEDEAEMLCRFKKLNAFLSIEDLHRSDIWDLAVYLLNHADRISNPQITEKAVTHLFVTLSWDIRRLLQNHHSNTTEDVKKLKKRRDQLLNIIKAIITMSADNVSSAFLCLCDLLVLLNWKLAADNENQQISGLEISLNRDFNNKINNFVVDNVFVSKENDPINELEQQEQIELMAKRRNLLAQFCKLIIHGILPITDASLVLRYYVEFYSDFGDILKQLLVKCREMDRITCARAISMALINYFEEMKSSSPNGIVDPVSDNFVNFRDLAKRFAMSFGPDAVRNRDAIATIHKYGILHGLEINHSGRRKQVAQPTNVAFLEVLLEFSPRLLRQDKIAVHRYLEKHCPAAADQLANEAVWQPFLLYRASLQDKSHDDSGSVRSYAPTRGKGRGRRRVESTPTPSEFSTV